jgi:hypothetical protein
MDFKEGIFSGKNHLIRCIKLLIFRGNIQEKEISIHICPDKKKNHISIDLANQLIIPKTSVIETKDLFGNKYDIKDLSLTLEDYKLVSNFEVTTIYEKEVDIILGSTWLETLGSLILNFEKKFLMFSYKKKKITLHDVSVKSDSISTSKDLDQISKMLLSDKQQSILEIQKECDKIIIDKDAEICRLKNHNQSLVTQIKKLKNEKKSQKERLEQFYSKEAMTSEETILEPIEIKKLPVKKIQTSEKGINTDLVELPIVSRVEERSNKQDSKEIQVPYRHPNHKSRYDQQQSQEEYEQCSFYRQLNYNIVKEQRQNRQLVWKHEMRSPVRTIDNQTVPMKVDLGWVTPQKMKHISLGIRRLYHLVSSRVTTTSTKDLRRHRVPEQKLKGKPSNDYALRTKHF